MHHACLAGLLWKKKMALLKPAHTLHSLWRTCISIFSVEPWNISGRPGRLMLLSLEREWPYCCSRQAVLLQEAPVYCVAFLSSILYHTRMFMAAVFITRRIGTNLNVCWSEVTQSWPALSDPMDSSLHQAPLSMGFSRQEYWSGLPLPFPGNLPDPGLPHCRQTLYCLNHRRVRVSLAQWVRAGWAQEQGKRPWIARVHPQTQYILMCVGGGKTTPPPTCFQPHWLFLKGILTN